MVVNEPDNRQPYVQVRGPFQLGLADGPTIRNDGQFARIVEGRVTVAVPHACFADPLPMMGVRHGKFSQEVFPVMRFEFNDTDGWFFVRLEH